MIEREAIRIATAFARETFERDVRFVSAHPGRERDDDDRDRRIWNVIFRAADRPDDDPRAELWVIVDAESGRARHFQTL